MATGVPPAVVEMQDFTMGRGAGVYLVSIVPMTNNIYRLYLQETGV